MEFTRDIPSEMTMYIAATIQVSIALLVYFLLKAFFPKRWQYKDIFIYGFLIIQATPRLYLYTMSFIDSHIPVEHYANGNLNNSFVYFHDHVTKLNSMWDTCTRERCNPFKTMLPVFTAPAIDCLYDMYAKLY
jgi:hypothetical protein